MRLADLSRWHWALIGGAVGALAAFSFTSSEVDNMPPSSVGAFLSRLGETSRQQLSQGQPILRNVVVYPPVEGAYKNQVQVVKFDRLGIDRASGKPAVASELVVVDLPLDFRGQQFGRVEQVLEQADQPYTKPWLRQPAVAYPVFVGAGLVGLCVFVPAILNVLSSGEYGRQRAMLKSGKNSSSQSSLSTNKPKPAESKSLVKKGPTPQEQAALDRLNQEMELKLDGFGRSAASSAEASEANSWESTSSGGTSSGPQPPTRLAGSADEVSTSPQTANPPQPTSAKPKSFAGEYYPVAKNVQEP